MNDARCNVCSHEFSLRWTRDAPRCERCNSLDVSVRTPDVHVTPNTPLFGTHAASAPMASLPATIAAARISPSGQDMSPLDDTRNDTLRPAGPRASIAATRVDPSGAAALAATAVQSSPFAIATPGTPAPGARTFENPYAVPDHARGPRTPRGNDVDAGVASTTLPLTLSIVSTLLGLIPVGIAAIVLAVQAGDMLRHGLASEARRRARNAIITAVVSLVLGAFAWTWVIVSIATSVE